MLAEKARRIGRPDQQASEDLVRNIVETATRLFVEQGYAATSIEQIAAASGSGKQTIYRRFESKAGLFKAVIDMRCRELVDIIDEAAASEADPLAALKQTCRRFMDNVLDPERLDMHRVLIAEARRFPDLGAYATATAGELFEGAMRRLVQAAIDAGELKPNDPVLITRLLNGAFTGWPLLKSLVGQPAFADPDERDAFAEAAWAIFLNGAA
jgi:AcrR family transcriptional regulator